MNDNEEVITLSDDDYPCTPHENMEVILGGSQKVIVGGNRKEVVLLSDDDEPCTSTEYMEVVLRGSQKEIILSDDDDSCQFAANKEMIAVSSEKEIILSDDDDSCQFSANKEMICEGNQKEIILSDNREAGPSFTNTIGDMRKDGESTSGNEVEEVPRKRRKRTREEIECSKIAKEVARIEREANTARNSKCEQYLHCYLNADILKLEDSLESKILSLFQERQIVEQLHVEDNLPPMHISWKRKTVEAVVENGKVTRMEAMIRESVFAYVMDAHSLSTLISSNTLLSHLDSVLCNYPVADARLTVIVYGNVTTRNDKLTDCFLEAFEKNRIQLRQIHNVDDFAYLVAQLHRALAKHDKSKEDESRSIFSTEKGMKREEVNDQNEFVRDWWGKMLLYMHRLSEDQRRAILKQHPNPFKLMDKLIAAPSPTAAMKDLADIVTENGRRLGPVLAQKIYHMLTSEDGRQMLTE